MLHAMPQSRYVNFFIILRKFFFVRCVVAPSREAQLFHTTPEKCYVMAYSFFILIEQQTI